MRQRPREEAEYGFVVVGGGLSGMCAALAAARKGVRTALVQARPVLGGNASSEVRMHICGAGCHVGKKNLHETGILHEILLENKRRNPAFSFPIWDSVLWETVRFQENLTLYLNTVMDSVTMDGDRIASILCRQETTEKEYVLSAPLFADATGNATLGYYAGAEFRTGSECAAEFGEPDAPETPNDHSMGNTILFMAADRGKPVPFTKPAWAYTFTEEDLRFRGHGKVTLDHGENGVLEEYMPSSGYWWIEVGGNSGDIIRHAEDVHEELKKVLFGVWDHLKNGGDHGAENYELEWVGSVPGIRESRRLVGDYLLNENDVLSNRVFGDAVAYGGWPMDEHTPGGIFDFDREPTRYIKFDGAYTIPFRCYCSKNVPNLMMAGRDISVTKMALGTVRVMGTCAVGGQAVGEAAAIAAREGCDPREVGTKHIRELQQTLLRDDCYIPGFRNEDPEDLARAASVSASGSAPGSDPADVVNGVARTTDRDNAWQSLPLAEGPAVLTLRLPAPSPVGQVRLTFDSDLSREIMISETKAVQDRQEPGLPSLLVRDFEVSLYRGETCVARRTELDNARRLRVLEIAGAPEADRIEIRPLRTWDAPAARIYEVRAYADASRP